MDRASSSYQEERICTARVLFGRPSGATLVDIGIRDQLEPNMTDVITAENKALVRRFYKEVYVDGNMGLADQVVSPQFTSHDWPEHGPTGPKAPRLLLGRTGGGARCEVRIGASAGH